MSIYIGKVRGFKIYWAPEYRNVHFDGLLGKWYTPLDKFHESPFQPLVREVIKLLTDTQTISKDEGRAVTERRINLLRDFIEQCNEELKELTDAERAVTTH